MIGCLNGWMGIGRGILMAMAATDLAPLIVFAMHRAAESGLIKLGGNGLVITQHQAGAIFPVTGEAVVLVNCVGEQTG